MQACPIGEEHTGGHQLRACRAAALSTRRGSDFHLTVDDPHASSPVQKDVVKQTVGAGYFAVLNEPILAGREFEQSDQRVDADATIASGAASALPLVLNQKAASRCLVKTTPSANTFAGTGARTKSWAWSPI